MDVIAVLVEGFFRDPRENLMLKGRAFRNLTSAHSTWDRMYHPIDLKKLGCYEANEGLEREAGTWNFSDVRGKCFPFHLNLQVDKNPANYFHSSALLPERMQRWVLMRLKHTCNAHTLNEQDVPPGRLYRKPFPQNPGPCDCQTVWKNISSVGDNHDLPPDYFNFRSTL